MKFVFLIIYIYFSMFNDVVVAVFYSGIFFFYSVGHFIRGFVVISVTEICGRWVLQVTWRGLIAIAYLAHICCRMLVPVVSKSKQNKTMFIK